MALLGFQALFKTVMTAMQTCTFLEPGLWVGRRIEDNAYLEPFLSVFGKSKKGVQTRFCSKVCWTPLKGFDRTQAHAI